MSRWLRRMLTLPVRLLALAAMTSLIWRLTPTVFAAADASGEPLVWWTSRVFGITAYVAIWLSMLCGLLIGARGIEGLLSRKVLMDLHQQWSLAAVLATALHVLTIVGHEVESHVAPLAAVVPFASESLTAEVALGTFAAWGLAIVAASSWLRGRIPYAAWRALHALVFGTFLLSLLHGIFAGTDTEAPWAFWMYLVTVAVLADVATARLTVAVARTLHPEAHPDARPGRDASPREAAEVQSRAT